MSPLVFFSIEDGALTISSGDTDGAWTGFPDGMSVLELHLDSDGSSAFVLLDAPIGGGRVSNLVRISSAAEIMWRGELPEAEPTDAFVSLQIDVDGAVLASTWSGYRVRLDPASGQLLSEVFTK